MKDLEAVWKLARADLIIATDDGGNDVFLWEHSLRVAKSAHYLSHLPQAQALKPDIVALLAACLYHDAGWITQLRAGEIQRFEILLVPPSETTVLESVRLMHKSLGGVLSGPILERAGETIRTRHQHNLELIEAHILDEADNLEEFGLGFLWTAIRRGLCGGKGVQAVLDAWKRRTEYHFWTARLKDSFRFEATRKLAESRLSQLESLMSEMTLQHGVDDVRLAVQTIIGSQFSPLFPSNEPETKARSQG